MKKTKPLLMIIGGALILLSSCYKESVYTDQLDVTLTKYDTEFDFSEYSTFWMPDSTVLKTNFMTETEINDFYTSGGTSEKTLAILQQKFIDCGYTLDDSSSADFIAVPTILKVLQVGATYYPLGWWWGYPGYGWSYPGYGWVYPSYYSYKEGTIILEMIDGDSYREIQEWLINPITEDPPDFTIRWMAGIDGYLSSNSDYNAERAERGINEAFEQSPYLKK